LKRTLSHCALIATLIAASAATLNAQNVAVDKTSLSFSAQFGGGPVSQPLQVTSSTGAVIQFIVSSNNTTLLKINGGPSTTGSTPSTVTISADPTGLLPGTYSATVLVSGGALTIQVPATLTVSSIGVNPSSLNFTGYTVGSANIPNAQTINLSGISSQFSAAATTTSGGNWLLVNPTSGTSPGVIFAQLNSAVVPGMAAGTYQGNIRVTPSGGTTNIPIDVPVSFTVSAAPVLSVTPSPLQFNFQLGQAVPAAQTLTLAVTPAAQVNFSLTSSSDANPAGRNWILFSPPAGSTNPQTGLAQVSVTADPIGSSALPAGTFTGNITVKTTDNPQGIVVPVKLVVSASPLLNIPTATLNFTSQLGCTTSPAAQNVNVTATSGTITYSVAASANTPWLTVPAAGSTAAPFSVSVNPCGLTAGTYTGSITVTGALAGSGTQQIPVTFKVSNDPVIVTNVGSLSFPFQIGQSAPADQSLRITSSTGTPLSFTATPSQTTCTGSNWLRLNGIAATPVSGSTDATVTVRVDPTGLPAGTCTGSISVAATITSSGVAVANSPVTIPVTLYVSNSALLVIPSTPVNFTAALGAQSVPSQSINLSSTSPTDQLTYTVSVPPTSSGGPWLAASQGGTTPGSITLFANPALLSAGTYTGSIVITATGPGGAAVANSPVTVPVTLTITTGSLTLSASSVTFTNTLGGAAPAPQTVTVGSSGAALTYSAVASSAGGWLGVSPASGNTTANGTLTITVDNTKLTAAGTYAGTITVASPGAGNSPATINVTVTVGGGTLTAPTTALTFTQVAGGPAPAAQSIAVTGSPGSLNFTTSTSTGTPWLTVSPPSGTTPGTVLVSATAGTMAIGQYNGSVTITAPGAAGSPITVPVVFDVVGSGSLTANPTSLTFNYNLGQTAPAAQSLVVSGSSTGVPISAQVQYSGTGNGGWLQVAPPTTTAPATLTVTVTPGSLAAGTYNATINITSSSALNPLNVPVTFTIGQIPKPVISAIGNAASYSTGGVSPGENIVIFGTGIGPDAVVTGSVANNVWGTTTGNTRVLFDGVAAPVIYASATQTSVMVPYGVSGRSTTSIVVEYSGVQSSSITFNVVAAAPGIYTLNQQGNGPGAILNQNGTTVNGANAPAPRGTVVSVYMTGEGQTNPAGVDGAIIAPVLSALKNPVLRVTATVGGVDAQVLYAGSAAGLISGVMQVNLMIPGNATVGGAVPLQISVGGVPTQAGVTIAVQ